jgi:hypothetical protein
MNPMPVADPYAGMSMSEVLRMKREQIETSLAAKQVKPVDPNAVELGPDGKETMESRKRRLMAQRDALIKKRKEDRE